MNNTTFAAQLLFAFFTRLNSKKISKESPTRNQPVKFLRLRDCPGYLGMDRHRFKQEVRPLLTAIPIGKRGIAFDILDLDAWADHHKACSGRPPKERSELWDAKKRQVSTNVGKIGTLTNKSSVDDFAKAQALIRSKKRNGT